MNEAIDRKTFETWMKDMSSRLERQERLIAVLVRNGYEAGNLPSNELPLTEEERLLDNQDVCMLLQLSKRTLQRYRSSRQLAYVRIGGKSYYKLSEINRFIKEHSETFRKEDAEILSPYLE